MNGTKTYNVDDLDLKILKILSIDGRKNKSTIAGEVERSPNTVIKRISNLEERGIIKNYPKNTINNQYYASERKRGI